LARVQRGQVAIKRWEPARFVSRVRLRGQRPDHAGFSTVELIVTISIAGIIAAIAVARFVDPGGFSSRGFYDRATAVVRQAQKVAIAQRRTIFVVTTADRVAVCYEAACTNRVSMSSEFGFTAGMGSALAKCADDREWLCAGTPDGVTLSSSTISFNSLGRPSASVTISLTSTIAGDPARQIVVEAETGYVHR
jgi:MSHA pilin protein MshC